MKTITNPQASAAWNILPPEQLMLSTTSLENANAALPEGKYLAYAYTPTGETHSYRRLGECDADAMPLGEISAPATSEEDTATLPEPAAGEAEGSEPAKTDDEAV